MGRMGIVARPQRAGLMVACVAALIPACSHKPPPDFAPDPTLVARLRQIRIVPASDQACPGEVIRASYEAVLNDSTVVPFETRYDKNRPPRLHVVFLNRTSPEAVSLEDGNWSALPDPLASAMNGFRLSAFFKAKPSVNAFATLAPSYHCLPHAFGFAGRSGDQSVSGEDGPDITVRLRILRSPFYDRLVVAAVEVGQAPPFFVLADASTVPPADWLIVETRGGRGGRGMDGTRGADGAAGAAGCPGAPGGPGGRGGAGGPGAAGGRGGRVTIIGPQEEPFLVGLVEGRSLGGEGGPGGRGGKGGAGGRGGAADTSDPSRRCQPGANGAAGADGPAGAQGPFGGPGPRPQTLLLPEREVFQAGRVPPSLIALIDYTERGR
ncbi:MAG TPA: hypothetical protein VNL18_06045 [Gemmatimonadales bacterium]|nr:hypothetical protein [Gemmatimonadales bacterium]